MPASTFAARCSFLRGFACLLALAISLCGMAQAQQRKAAPEQKQKIRAITAFVNLDRLQYQLQIADAVKMLKYARTVFESRGFEVQTIRIATQPFPEYTQGMSTDQIITFFKDYDALAQRDGFAASIGPAMLNETDSPAQADLLADILLNTKTLNGILSSADQTGCAGQLWERRRA